MARFKVVNILFWFLLGFGDLIRCYKFAKNDENCPEVKARSNCDLDAVRMRF